MGGILATAIERAQGGTDLESAIAESAYSAGSGQRTRAARRARRVRLPPTRSSAQALSSALAWPMEADIRNGSLCLHNCPFDVVCWRHRDLACGRQHFVRGVLDDSKTAQGLDASLELSETVLRRGAPQHRAKF